MVRLGDGNGPLSTTESDIMELSSYTRCELIWHLHLKQAEHKKRKWPGSILLLFAFSTIPFLFVSNEGIKDLNNLI